MRPDCLPGGFDPAETEPTMRGHVHAASMALYAQDAAETDKPWDRWQWRREDGAWVACDCHPNWFIDQEYRRKPKTIRIGAFDVPEPLRVAPAEGDAVFHVDINQGAGGIAVVWSNSVWQRNMLGRGLLHPTREAAQLHAKALLSFTTEIST